MSLQEDSPSFDVNPDALMTKVETWVNGAIRLVPNLVVASVALLLFIGVAWFAKRQVGRLASRHGRDNLGDVLGGFVKWTILILGFLIAATIVFPQLNPADLIAGLGVSSVAIGFAFKDILQNWLAGLLILIRQPFEVGDQIEVNGFEGTVQRIETRATILKTYDGQNAVIPNSDIYTNAILVKTAHEFRRSQYDVGIGYGDSLEDAKRVLEEAVAACDGVETERGVEVLPWDLAASWVTLRVRWWTRSDRASVVQAQSRVIAAVKAACDGAGIDMPFETHIQLVHDQTEAADGDREAQREGWPAGDEGSTPRWRAREAAAPTA
ncbi:Small-conductance mechanosensitive channel [Planctomycetes bacterium Poly30]|uniref:Small-conductance mechanosensitive channel n=2 Tax=Saltatorellus ferox TaxID=2528018 RepID=A0A518EN99_9BACT|nr:Small-conductance mechanosensitive channel [Planctomycetes bacterium Poly30]